MPDPHHPTEFEVEGQRHGMGRPQGQGPLGCGCGKGLSPFRELIPLVCPPLLHWLEIPGELRGHCLPRAPSSGGGNISPTPASGQALLRCFTALTCQISPPLWHVVPPPPPRQPPKGTDHLATFVHDLDPHIWTEGLLEVVEALILQMRTPGPTEGEWP